MLFPPLNLHPESMDQTTAGTRRWGAVLRSVFLALLTSSLFAIGARVIFYGMPADVVGLFSRSNQAAAAAASVSSLFAYDFNVHGVLEETETPDESPSPYWWLDSGGRFIVENGVGHTVQGALPTLDEWRVRYRLSNALDTENGYAPQNLFRLFTRSNWEDVRVTSDFRIMRDNFTESPNRDASNGLLFISRYKDSDNFYYAGIRVDGQAVIAKKNSGTDYTLTEKLIFGSASTTYNRRGDMNLLPHDEWLNLRMETMTTNNGSVRIKLLMKKPAETKWTELLQATDDGKKYASTTPITGTFPIGIRTDFMDVEFDNFKVETI